MNMFLRFRNLSKVCLITLFTFATLYSCTKDDNKEDYQVNNSLTLFKLDNNNNNLDLTSNDTVSTQSGVSGKFILVSGAAGAAKGLDSVKLEIYTIDDSLLNAITISSFYKPEYHVINAQLNIPASQRGKVYKIMVKVIDKAGTIVGTKSFYGIDVVSCDPLPACLVNNQITVMVETPPGTPETDNLYIFGSLNGWNRGDVTFQLHKNAEVPNCYCVTIPFPPGYTDWQVGEVYVSRGLWENDAINFDNSSFIVNYTTTDLGPLWKIKVPKWRDK